MTKVNKGFRVSYAGQETFVVTERKRPTKALARKVCKEMSFPTEDWMVTDMQCCLHKATLETKITPKYGTMYTIESNGYRDSGIENVRIIRM
mgnify:CR=1 FL=1